MSVHVACILLYLNCLRSPAFIIGFILNPITPLKSLKVSQNKINIHISFLLIFSVIVVIHLFHYNTLTFIHHFLFINQSFKLFLQLINHLFWLSYIHLCRHLGFDSSISHHSLTQSLYNLSTDPPIHLFGHLHVPDIVHQFRNYFQFLKVISIDMQIIL